ncbi:MAG TPA: protein-L-isoaspartate O-methyltransferase [Chromatiales bacterium]|nr:protein-L-isoaspartate O-methyltransferase [Chromatiales bacterium]
MMEFDVDRARFNMIEQQIRPWEVLDQRVLDTIAAVPRERFVPERYRHLAFADLEIPLGHDQFMMAPKVEARMLQSLEIRDDDLILEIGTGSGYVTACLARLGRSVDSVDIFADFTESARAKLEAEGIRNVMLETGDAAHGWNQGQEYDVIAVTGSLPEYVTDFERQLAVGGRLFVVVGEPPVMEAMLVRRVREEEFHRTPVFETCLRPLLHVSRRPRFAF